MNNPVGVISSNNDVSSRAIGKIREILTQGYSHEQPKAFGVGERSEQIKALDVLEKMNQTSKIASQKIADIVTNLRSFVKLDEAEWQMADIHEGIDNAIALMEMEPEFSSRIKVTTDYCDIPKIYCSPSSLNQVFRSMLRNASEAIEGSGEISIKTVAEVAETSGPGILANSATHVKIEITDTGKGIPAENLDRIFDPGFTTKGVRVGVGFGLPICYQIVVDGHQGRIDVSSQLGQGTKFVITLPHHSSRTNKS
jgi:signal transduction histidine kinase